MSATPPDRMLAWFAYEHLREPYASTSKRFHDLAQAIVLTIDVALRKLLESKDAAVRAVVQPGG